MTNSSYLSLQVFCLVSTECEAADIVENLVHALQGLGLVTAGSPQPYWKIPEYYECSIQIHKPLFSASLLSNAIEILGSGWERVNGCCFVWNSSDDTTFIESSVRWAEAEFFEE